MQLPEKFPMVDNMRRYGGNFVSKLAETMIAADTENYKRLCFAFPAIINKYQEDIKLRNPTASVSVDCCSIEEEGLPAPDHRDLLGRAWFGHRPTSDPETGEPYAASWTLTVEPYGIDTHWAAADSIPIPR